VVGAKRTVGQAAGGAAVHPFVGRETRLGQEGYDGVAAQGGVRAEFEGRARSRVQGYGIRSSAQAGVDVRNNVSSWLREKLSREFAEGIAGRTVLIGKQKP